MSDFVNFWIHCLFAGFQFAYGIVDAIGILALLVSGFLLQRKRHEHRQKWEDFAVMVSFRVFLLAFAITTIFIAPFLKYDEADKARKAAQKALDDKSPKLEGFIHRVLSMDQGGTTDSILLIDVSISNIGATPSIAEDYALRVPYSTNRFADTEDLDFSDEYTNQLTYDGKPWRLDLKRNQLVSEKTIKAIPIGESVRGWLAYRVKGMKSNQCWSSNLFLKFYDIAGNKIYTTNGIWLGKALDTTNYLDFATIIPGAENIFYPIEPTVEANTDWLPPELPPGCSNVTVFFGANGITYSRFIAEISADNGTKFAIKDVPDYFLAGLDKLPNYSPRQHNMWLKYSNAFEIGGKTIPYPVQPIIISNRLFVEVETPFSNEKHKLMMSDSFDPDLPMPRLWDRNYSTNYYANGIVSGGIYAYEVVNELTNPVLQVAYSAPNEVHINGIFKVDTNSILVSFGQQPMLLTFAYRAVTNLETTQRITTVSLEGTNFSEILHIYTNDSIESIGEMYTNEFYRPIFPGQRAIFKYPSNRSLGIFSDWPIIETNKSDTNIIDRPPPAAPNQ